MTSPARTRVSPPSWGPRPSGPALARVRATRGPPRRARPIARTVNAAVELARRVEGAVTSEAIAGLALLAGWTLLWILFLLGIVEPAAALRLVR